MTHLAQLVLYSFLASSLTLGQLTVAAPATTSGTPAVDAQTQAHQQPAAHVNGLGYTANGPVQAQQQPAVASPVGNGAFSSPNGTSVPQTGDTSQQPIASSPLPGQTSDMSAAVSHQQQQQALHQHYQEQLKQHREQQERIQQNYIQQQQQIQQDYHQQQQQLSEQQRVLQQQYQQQQADFQQQMTLQQQQQQQAQQQQQLLQQQHIADANDAAAAAAAMANANNNNNNNNQNANANYNPAVSGTGLVYPNQVVQPTGTNQYAPNALPNNPEGAIVPPVQPAQAVNPLSAAVAPNNTAINATVSQPGAAQKATATTTLQAQQTPVQNASITQPTATNATAATPAKQHPRTDFIAVRPTGINGTTVVQGDDGSAAVTHTGIVEPADPQRPTPTSATPLETPSNDANLNDDQGNVLPPPTRPHLSTDDIAYSKRHSHKGEIEAPHYFVRQVKVDTYVADLPLDNFVNPVMHKEVDSVKDYLGYYLPIGKCDPELCDYCFIDDISIVAKPKSKSTYQMKGAVYGKPLSKFPNAKLRLYADFRAKATQGGAKFTGDFQNQHAELADLKRDKTVYGFSQHMSNYDMHATQLDDWENAIAFELKHPNPACSEQFVKKSSK